MPLGERGGEFGRGLKDGHRQGGKGYLGLYVAAGFGVRERGGMRWPQVRLLPVGSQPSSSG